VNLKALSNIRRLKDLQKPNVSEQSKILLALDEQMEWIISKRFGDFK